MAKWAIAGTDHQEEGTEIGYRRLSMKKTKDKSLKGKNIVFVDDQGVIHEDISTPTQARKAGLLVTGKVRGPVLTAEGLIEYTLTLPAEAFALFNMAKSFGLIKDGQMDFDQWVYECIDRRFAADYKVQVVLQPLAGQGKEGIRQIVKEVVKEEMAGGKGGGDEQGKV